MPIDGSETILCVPSDAFRNIVGEERFGGGDLPTKFLLPDAYGLFDRLLRQADFVPRTDELERDFSWKQVIPYVVITRSNRLFWYSRPPSGGDPRLQGRLSVGVGGHVRDTDVIADWSESSTSKEMSAFWRALFREAGEEVGLTAEHLKNEDDCVGKGHYVEVVGILNDDSDDVGRAHVGVVAVANVGPSFQPKAIDGVDRFGFEDPTTLNLSRFSGSVRYGFARNAKWEGWSEMAVHAFYKGVIR